MVYVIVSERGYFFIGRVITSAASLVCIPSAFKTSNSLSGVRNIFVFKRRDHYVRAKNLTITGFAFTYVLVKSVFGTGGF